jgi:hypothetical protein
MVVSLIVLAVSLLMAGFFLVWLVCPRLRPWMEAPKYRVLQWEQRFPQAERGDSGEAGC